MSKKQNVDAEYKKIVNEQVKEISNSLKDARVKHFLDEWGQELGEPDLFSDVVKFHKKQAKLVK